MKKVEVGMGMSLVDDVRLSCSSFLISDLNL